MRTRTGSAASCVPRIQRELPIGRGLVSKLTDGRVKLDLIGSENIS